MNYVPNTDAEREAMLAEIGVGSVEELFADIPAEKRRPPLQLPRPLSEPEVLAEMHRLADRNGDLNHYACFLGAGAYHHFIPSVVGHVISRSEFYTAYTPYQPEVSQGTLQSIWEYQSLTCKLTGMDVANASHYDGATALAEAALMAVRLTGRYAVAIGSAIHPEYEAVLRTYAQGVGVRVETIPDYKVVEGGDYACLLVQQPNFFGNLEDVLAMSHLCHLSDTLFVVAVNPISLGLLKSPGEYGADIVIGDVQPLGVPLSFGGHYAGLFACKAAHVRQMPGRIVGQTVDKEGRRGFVLTLQTREQHIRRERATSNICTNQALVALAATVYLAAMGKHGLRKVAELCYQKAQYAARRIAALPGYDMAFNRRWFFNEFTVRCPLPPAEINRRLLDRRIIGGLDVSHQVDGGMLLCFTELNTREEIDRLVDALAEIGAAVGRTA